MTAQSPGRDLLQDGGLGDRHMRMLREALDAARQLNDEARSLTPRVDATEGLDAAGRQISRLCGGSCGQRRPCLLIVGQAKVGKSALINELLLGAGTTACHQCRRSCLTRFTYSPEPSIPDVTDVAGARNNNDNDADAAETMVYGLPSEFLRAGFDLVDTPGLNDTPHRDEVTLAAIESHAPIVAFVIDANHGFNCRVEADILRTGALVGGPDRLFYVVTKMDVHADDVAETAGCDSSAEAVEREKLQRVLAGMRRIGCLPPGEEAAGGAGGEMRRFCCLSSRHAALFRRRQRRLGPQAKPASAEEARWVAAFRQAQAALAEFVHCRLRQLAAEAAACLRQPLLRDLGDGLRAAASAADDIGHVLRIRLGDIEHSAARLRAEAVTAVSLNGGGGLSGRIAGLLVRGRSAIEAEARLAEYRCCTAPTSEEPGAERGSVAELPDIEARAAAEICARVSSIVRAQIQQCVLDAMADSYCHTAAGLMEKIEAFASESTLTEPLLASLAALKTAICGGYSVPEQSLTPTPHQLQQLQQRFRLNRGAAVLFRKPRLLTAAASEVVRDPDWKGMVAGKFLGTVARTKLGEQIVKDLLNWIEKQHGLIAEAIRDLKAFAVKEAQTGQIRAASIASLQSRCLVLTFQLNTVLTECRFGDLNWDGGTLLAEGIQGSRVFSVKEAAGAFREIAVKEILLTDSELMSMAPGLHFCCSAESDISSSSIVKITGMRLHRLSESDSQSDRRKDWRLQLCMNLLPLNLRAYLREGAGRAASLRDRLTIGLATAQALAGLHAQRVAHLNLHPGNVFILDVAKASVKLADFGQRVSSGPDSSVPAARLFSRLIAEDIRSLGLILKLLALGTAEADIEQLTDAELATLGEELSSLLQTCAQQTESGDQCHRCISALQVADVLRGLVCRSY